ncbi:MAG: GNAT family N-acetyltransferase [Dehalococcoidia bacterium]|nr:GNAT family N-acetyltransferase [Dehalococcoidia bacterium]
MEFYEVDAARWEDMEHLFQARGGPKYCWCMVWRRMPKGTSRSDSKAKKEALRQRVVDETPIGILGYVDGEPMAWCSIAPRDTYRELGGSKFPADPSNSIWSIACFYLPRRLRGLGLTRQLIYAALDHARKKGAAVVEAYPVDPDSPSYKFMGLVSTFEALGFEEVGRAGTRRHVMRLFL